MNTSTAALMLMLVVITALMWWLCAGVGFGTWQNPFLLDETLRQLRLPRVWIAAVVGFSLAAAGSVLQALFENPLADPSLIGTSGGAALGVVLVLFFGLGGVAVPVAAFVGSLTVCVFVLLIHAWLGGGRMGLLIMGFIISAFCGALVSLLLFLSNDLVLRSAMNWLAGSLIHAGLVAPAYAVTSMLLGVILLIFLGRRLDILMLGEDVARSMGVHVGKTRTAIVVGAALLTAAAVSLAGVIGFVGMMIPNILAHLIGGTRRRLMLASAWAGAVFLPVVDAFARLLAYPIDVPVGIVISLLGGPFFMWLFLQSIRRGMMS